MGGAVKAPMTHPVPLEATSIKTVSPANTFANYEKRQEG
jgi:hypothetical protein